MKKTKKTVKASKKKTVKKAPVKKATKKAAPKPVVKRAPAKKEVITAQPITDETGVVVMKSVDDHDDADDNSGVSMKAVMEGGVLTMVPDED